MTLTDSNGQTPAWMWGDRFMFQPWRLRIRQAEEASRRGKLEEAAHIVLDPSVKDFLPAVRLAPRVAGLLMKRGRQRGEQGDLRGAWSDYDLARRLAPDSPDVDSLRTQLAAAVVSEAERHMKAGDPCGALRELEALDRREIGTGPSKKLREVSEKWAAALTRSRQGDFSQAELEFATAAALVPGISALELQRRQCRQALDEFRGLNERLHDALGRGAWTEVLAAADRMLELAPEHIPARAARRRAWAVVGTSIRDPLVGARIVERPLPVGRAEDTSSGRSMDNDTVTQGPDGLRFILWVDAVGGFLVCCGDDVVLGQPVSGSAVDVPILADLSRRHAKIRREGEGYMIQPGREVKLDGRAVEEAALLRDQSLIELGSGVLLRFRRPHALSATARLEFVSRHRTQPWVDGVILMAQTCILGPARHNHIVCRHWPVDVVLSQQKGELFLRTKGSFEVDGEMCHERARIKMRSRIQGDGFSFGLEPV